MLSGKKILLAVCGSIAAYKAAFLCRLLVKSGAQVKVIMTDAAIQFVSPLTLSTLSKHPVYSSYSDKQGNWNNHVDLGLWPDMMLIAPATANTIAKMANGICDNLLTATYLSAKCKVLIAPAMDLDMWKHPATQNNITTLQSFGNHIIPVGTGELASGLEGEGRMAEPEAIISQLETLFSLEKKSPKLNGKKVLITAGPTVESIDPVRFISNHSSGKMGIAVAEAFQRHGAEVILIKGPTSIQANNSNIRVVNVSSAQDMFDATEKEFSTADIVVMAAAVADYTPAKPTDKKIKKNGSGLTVDLVKTIDILQTLGQRKQKNQLLVGFALETHNALENAKNKLKAKNADMIILNTLQDKGAGFGIDTNKITILDKKGGVKVFDLKTKPEVALDIVSEIENYLDVE